jgi:aspartyl-tRNA(Asn)/glutamyl-tRNA(Gln) amidotransferase subunit A
MSGYVKEDYTSAKMAVPDFTEKIFEGVKNMRLAFCPDLHFSEIDNAVEDALVKAGRQLQEAGAQLKTVPFTLKDIVQKTRENLYWAEFVALHRSRFNQFPDGYGEDLKEQLTNHNNVTTDDYVQACYDRLALRRTFEDIFEDVDALLLPSSPCVAPLIADGTSLINGKVVNFGEVGLPLRQPVNVVGLPSISVSMGFSDGLPIAMQIIGPAWSEAEIIRICHTYEVATPDLRGLKPLNC